MAFKNTLDLLSGYCPAALNSVRHGLKLCAFDTGATEDIDDNYNVDIN